MSYQLLQSLSQLVILVGGIMLALGGFGAFYFEKKVEQEKENNEKIQSNLAKSKIETPKAGASTGKTKPSTEVLKIRSFKVAGYLYDADNQEGLSRVEVRIDNEISETDTNGYFHMDIKGILGESKEIIFSKPGYYPFPSREKIKLPEDAIHVYLKKQNP